MKKEDENLNVAMMGIKFAVLAVAVSLLLEAVSIFLPNSKINPIIVGILFLLMGLILFFFATKIKIKKIKT